MVKVIGLVSLFGHIEREIGLSCVGGHQSVSCGYWFHFVALSSTSIIYISVPPLIFSSYKQTRQTEPC